MPKRTTSNGVNRIKAAVRPHFPRVRAYRYNPASIRVRVIDPRFKGKSHAQREDMVLPLLSKLPVSVQADITLLLLLTPDETSGSLTNLEFEKPTRSGL